MTPGPFQRPVGSPNGPVTRLGVSLVAFLITRVDPRAPQKHPKGSPRPTKVALWRQNGRLQWPFRAPSRPKSLLKHRKALIVRQNLNFSPPNHQISFKINDFQQSIVHRRPTDVQRTSPSMGRRQCYAHQVFFIEPPEPRKIIELLREAVSTRPAVGKVLGICRLWS